MSNVTVEGNTRQTPDTLPCQLIADPDQACVWVGMTYAYDILLCKNICCYKKCYVRNRGVTIRYPHDTIRIAILESRYDTYRDTW